MRVFRLGYSSSNSLQGTIRTITASGNLLSTDTMLLVDATSGLVNVTLPSAATVIGRIFHVKKIDASVNNVKLIGTVDGVTTKALTTINTSFQFSSNGTSYYIL